MEWTSRIRFWQNWEFFSSVSWQTFELIKTRSCGVQTPTYPTDFHHRWWRLRHTKVRASTKAAGWGFHSEVRVLCEVLGCGFLHLRNLHEELILGSNIVVGSRCSCVAGGVRIIMWAGHMAQFLQSWNNSKMHRFPNKTAPFSQNKIARFFQHPVISKITYLIN